MVRESLVKGKERDKKSGKSFKKVKANNNFKEEENIWEEKDEGK